jgi:hypothetical protein
MSGRSHRSTGASWMEASGQRWKLHVFYGLMAAGAVFGVNFIADVNGSSLIRGIDGPAAAIIFATMPGTALLWLVLSIRCSICGMRPVGSILKHTNANSWLEAITSLSDCPKCSHSRAKR